VIVTAYDAATIADQATVRNWVRSAKIEGKPDRLELLALFCMEVDRGPDDMIDDCLRAMPSTISNQGTALEDEAQLKLRYKVRRRYVDSIDEFEATHRGRSHGNVIRSFFIHNGVPIQPPILT
jgi:hypothetical protein